MSLIVKTVDGEVKTRFVGIPIEAIAIGEHEIPLEHFCDMARHFLSGGFLGWGTKRIDLPGETPECVNVALTRLFRMYKRTENGKWVGKSLEELKKEMRKK